MEQVIEILLRELKVPQEDADEFAEQVKERRMGELFAVLKRNLEQERKQIRQEGIADGKAQGIVQSVKLMGGTMEMAAQQLVTLCDIDTEKSLETAKLYW